MTPFRSRHGRWLLCVGVALLLMVRLLTFGSPRSVGATSETFFTGPAPCPMAHCNPYLDGREMNFAQKTILSLPVSTPPSQAAVAAYTPPTPVAFNSGLGCSVGLSQDQPTPTPNMVECDGAKPSTAGSSQGPFVYNVTASGGSGSPALGLNWTSAPYTGPPSYPCANAPLAMNGYVGEGAPLFSDLGYSYVSDSQSIGKYQPAAGPGTLGLCQWGVANPAHAAMISWNVLHLPPSGSGPNAFKGDFFLVGQGIIGPVLLVGYAEATVIAQLTLPAPAGESYITYNTISAVQTATGARVYDSTALCPSSGCSNAYQHVPGRLWAIDITSPTTQGGTPTMNVAWSFDFEGPSGASPMLLRAASGAPVGDRIFFDGSGTSCGIPPPCPEPHPYLFGIDDACPFGSTTCSNDPTPFLQIDVSQAPYNESGICQGVGYLGIQAAPALEGPEGGGGGDYSVWAYATCGTTLYRFDAETGQPWTSSQGGASSINIPTVTGLKNYIPSSTMNTVIDTHTGHTTMFVGAELEAGSDFSYVLALDLETGSLFWKVYGPTTVPHTDDTPFNGQFPIAQTTAGGNVLIASTRGQSDGSTILAIPLS